jgi:hypothetical protein
MTATGKDLTKFKLSLALTEPSTHDSTTPPISEMTLHDDHALTSDIRQGP